MKVKATGSVLIWMPLLLVFYSVAPQCWATTATATTLAVTSGGSAATSVTAGSVVTLTATVQSASAPVTAGQVKFCDATAPHCTDIHLLGTAQLTSAGTAAIRLVPGVGSHSYAAVFVGTNSSTGSSSSASALTVSTTIATTTSIAQTGFPGNYTLTATVAGSVYKPGLAAPTGSVSFLDTTDGNASLAVSSLGQGVSALNWTKVQDTTLFGGLIYAAISDFNGDGKADLAVTDGSKNLMILLGNGDGTFTAAPSVGLAASISSISVGDFNGDGISDLAVLNTSSTLTILLGNGDGTFREAAPTPFTGTFLTSMATGDFNGDGIADLAITNGVGNTVSILLGNGDGTFTPTSVSPATGPVPYAVAVADLNGDGKADLAIVNENNGGPGTVTILLGKGDGTFTAAASPSLPASGSYITIGDFNGDGVVDLAVSSYSYPTNTVSVLLGKGDGTFTAAPNLTMSANGPFEITVGDFSGDGKPDLAVSTNQGVAIYLGNGDGTFTASTSPTASLGTFILAGDFNGDGKADLAVDTPNGIGPNTSILVLLSQITETAIAAASNVSPTVPGPQLVDANYSGDSTYGLSASRGTVLFRQAPPSTTTLAVTSGGSPVTMATSGSVVTLTASVAANSSPVTTGQVDFCDATAAYCTDVHLLGVSQLTSTGTAEISFVPGIGNHSYKAVFRPTSSDQGSSSSASSLTVTGKYSTLTTIAQLGVPGSYTLMATVSGQAGTLAPSSLAGTVSFLDTSNVNNVLAMAVLGTAVPGWLNTESLATGNSPIAVAVADFNGDGKADLAVTDINDKTVTILLGNGDGTFTSVSGTVAGDNSNAVAVGDFNGDGKPDLAVATTDRGITILLGNGDGTFTATSISPSAGTTPQSIAVGDFNDDGKADLAVANYGSNTVTILLGNGDGTFIPAAASPATGAGPYSIVAGDFNGDGQLDLAVANSGSSTLTVLLGKGDGTFTAAANPATGTGPRSVAAGDFNGDGQLDLSVANYQGNTLTILLGKGDGTFTAAANPAIGVGPTAVAVGDFNGDGEPDLAVTNLSANSVTILLGKGDGTFTAGVSPKTGANPDAIAVGDFNGDGISDIATGDFTTNTVSVLLAQELTATATATGVAPVGVGPHWVDARYSGNSNYSASVSGNTLLWQQALPTTTTLALTSNGSPVTTVAFGTAATLTATVTAGSTSVGVGVVDFCDATAPHCTDIHLFGAAQLTSAGTATLTFVPGIGGHSYKAVFLGTIHLDAASSSAAVAVTVTAPAKFPTTTSISEIGSTDNYTLTSTVASSGGTAPPTGTISFLDTSNGNAVLGTAVLGSGETGLTWVSPLASTTSAVPRNVAVGDFNGDGILDLAVSTCSCNDIHTLSGTLNILLGNGDGTFRMAPSPASGNGYGPVAVGDFNGDGKLDLAVTNPYGTSVTILLGNGDGTFRVGTTPPMTGVSTFVAVGDFNLDGKLDLAVVNGGNTVTVLLGNGDGTFTASPNPPTSYGGSYIAVADFNGDGIPDLAVANFFNASVTILLGNGDGTFTTKANLGVTDPTSIAVGDFTGNGILDLAVASSFYNQFVGYNLMIWKGNGAGGFTLSSSPLTGGAQYSVVVGDFNGDGKDDLAMLDGNTSLPGFVSILLGNGDGTFTTAPLAPPTGRGDSAMAVGDFNGDGIPDLVEINSLDNTALVLLAENYSATATVTGVSVLGTGTHLVEASYPGDGSHAPSVSGTIPLTAHKAVTQTTLATSANPVLAGQMATFTATVSASAGGTPTGTVDFKDGANTMAAGVPLNAGVATFSTSALTAGAHTITVVYNSDAIHVTSISPTLTQVINNPGDTVTSAALALIVLSPHLGERQNVIELKQGATLMATITPSPGANGNVVFMDGTTTLGSVPVTGQPVTLGLTNVLSIGQHTIQAIFSGGGGFQGNLSTQLVVWRSPKPR